jgi:protein-tyrosine phosphatase
MNSGSVRSILFVCMGNICRSPMAEVLFRHKATLRGVEGEFFIDSAGTGGWHEGDRPDERMRRMSSRNGIELDGSARQVRKDDFETFDMIVCMDDDNYRNLLAMGAPVDRLSKMLQHDPGCAYEDVPDPYYGDGDGFQNVFDLLEQSCHGLLESLLEGDT